MKTYIREHSKVIVIVAVILICTVVGVISAPTIIAKMQPILSETLSVAEINVKEDVFDYTGEEIVPEIEEISFVDQEKQPVVKNSDEFRIVQYLNNIEVGQASVEITIDGYQGTLVIENVFRIQPAQASGLQVTSATREAIDLSWDVTLGADGYALYKSTDGGQNYSLIYQSASNEAVNYQDTEIQTNAIYMYYVCAYKFVDEEQVFGNPSETIRQYTQLDNSAILSVQEAAYNTLRINWSAVNGAAGYQLYRSNSQDGEYQCVAEITDGTVTSYDDTTCECGRTYYYSVKVCQAIESETIYGEASPSVSGKTSLGKVSISGTSGEGNTKVTLSWKKVNGAQGYEVYKNGNLVKTIENADTLSWSESGLSKEAEATYKVRAYSIIDGVKIYGPYSGTYEKAVTITYTYKEVSSEASSEVAALTKYAGYKYVFGGTSPTSGWDCSGFTQYVFRKHFGISLSRTASEQVASGSAVNVNDRSSWQPGDLLFYKKNGQIGHVAIYLGNGQMIHALSSKYGTLIQDVDYYEWWDSKTSLYCVRRYL